MDAGLLPVKRLRDANGRLAEGLGEHGRLELSRALLADALERCVRTSFLRWWVITDDAEVRDAALTRGLDVVADPGRGLNEALAMGIEEVRRAGADSVTIVPVDVPLATDEDVRDVIDTGATSDVVLVPARAGGGTNALCLSPPDALRPRFGEASLRAHAAEAESANLRCSILAVPGLALDLDTLEDVEELLEHAPDSAIAELLRRYVGGRERAPRLE